MITCPMNMRPSTGTSNAEELIFDKLDSGYLVSVATNEGAGRSATAQLLHASEAAFWIDLPLQMASLMQTVPDLDGTEIIIESTANGYNDFQRIVAQGPGRRSRNSCRCSCPGHSIPAIGATCRQISRWTRRKPSLPNYTALMPNRSLWRRAKISQLGSAEKFPQEYPLSPEEAFVSSNFDSFIPAAAGYQSTPQ